MTRRKPETPKGETPEARIVQLVTGAPVHRLSDQVDDAIPPDDDPPWADEAELGEDVFDEEGPSELRDGGGGDASIDLDAVKRCAGYDHSDTDNGLRLIAHFGNDLTVMAKGGVKGGDWLHWDGKHWDLDGGAAGAALCAQRVGYRIACEAEYLEHTPQERAALAAAKKFDRKDNSDSARAARKAAEEAKEALGRRKSARRKFAITSKNSARMKNMLEEAAPHLRKDADVFNSDAHLVVTQTHTLRFDVREMRENNVIVDRLVNILADKTFRREDYATGLVPCDYDPKATCSKFQAFLDQTKPDKQEQRTIQQYAGVGLLGILPQRLMFHYGSGANGKSVFLKTIFDVIGKSYGVSLPKETIMGVGERGAGQASPDIVRLFGKRAARVDELKDGENLREDLVKRLTGGDEMAVRNLFQGYFDFANVATAHMSGNGMPRIEGTDNGIWRRVLVVHWDVTIPEGERRNFDELVADLLTERIGILNWLLEGARDYLENGLCIAPKIAEATKEYREDMDPVGRFMEDCVRAAPGGRVASRKMFEAYKNWGVANGHFVDDRHQTRFGKEMNKRCERSRGASGRVYLDVELHDVPEPPHRGGRKDEIPPPEEGGGF